MAGHPLDDVLQGVEHDVGSDAESREHVVQVRAPEVLRDVLEIQAQPKTDEEIMEIIHETELFDVNWNDDTFRKCMKDLSKALGVRVRLAYHVVQMNTVTMRFRRAQASTILGSLCNYFELRYVIQDGEVVRIETRRGKLELPVWIDGRGEPPRGTLFVPFFDEGRLINDLTLDAHDPFSKQPDFKKCAARVRRLAGGTDA